MFRTETEHDLEFQVTWFATEIPRTGNPGVSRPEIRNVRTPGAAYPAARYHDQYLTAAGRTEGSAIVNRSPEPTERLPVPPYPWVALAACVVPPVVALLLCLEARMFGAVALELDNGARLPLGYPVVLIAAFPLIMPPDVRHLAALVSATLLGSLALVWLLATVPLVAYLLPVIVLLLVTWFLNHPRLLTRVRSEAAPDEER